MKDPAPPSHSRPRPPEIVEVDPAGPKAGEGPRRDEGGPESVTPMLTRSDGFDASEGIFP